ncbi:cardiolipin synthase [Blautia obeum]|uniref:cardiolipin synthase n=1 Tax=Blautia obeum TaxID=40520 RepID=UPI003562EA19
MRFLKRILKLLFNRIFYVAAALLLQLGWLLIMAWRLAAYSKYISNAIAIISILVVLWIVNKKINPSYKLGWTILILTVPVFGVLLYLLFGKSRIAQAIQYRYAQAQEESLPYMRQDEETFEELKEQGESAAVQSRYIHRYSGFPVHGNTTAEYFQVGDDMFPVLVRELEQAQHYIYIEYFIINDGVMWRTILDILERKAKEGVDVRLIYDGFGCLTTLPNRYDKILQEKGIKCVIFNPFRPILNIVQNNRDHRKICVIDGKTGFTGGINLADEYINQKERFGHWKDTAVMLKGEAVWNMTVMFMHMWSVVNGSRTPMEHELHMPHRYHPEAFEEDGFVQPYSDTPLDGEVLGENVYLNIINRARKYVYICTPYLIIDNEMMTALCLAAKSGVDVRIMTPGVPDKKMVFLLTQSYYEQLLEAGVRVYEYQPGFLHAKSFVCDDEIAVVGTINLDYRSLYLHFENGVWFYKNKVVADIFQDFKETLNYCDPINIEFCKNRNILVRGFQSILRLLAPLL